MSVSKWAYLPDRCDGDVCVGDCDLCSKTQDNVAMMDMDSDTISRKAAIDIASGYCHPSNIAEELAKLPSAHRPVDEWCVDCAEYDHDKHCCPRFNRVIRTAVDDAVPVVRCGECKHMTADGRCLEFADDNLRPSASDFCSYGERREDGDNDDAID